MTETPAGHRVLAQGDRSSFMSSDFPAMVSSLYPRLAGWVADLVCEGQTNLDLGAFDVERLAKERAVA
ncbi:hypothetical protein F2981_32880 (plasmid) [Sinorhizobium meliloti]|nr:hypothetical protein [Sinorhizobium meliloti]